MRPHPLALSVALALLLVASGRAADAAPKDLAETYADAVRKVNEAHAKSPGAAKEGDLGKRLPKDARPALDRLLSAADSAEAFEALVACGEAALDLDLIDDFERVRARLEKAAPEHAARLGVALSRPRFLLRGLGGLERKWLETFASVLDAVLDAYADVFGFAEWSKVPGKKIRVRVHFEEKAKAPPHFGPEFPFHSEVDFPVEDKAAFTSPTPDGKFLFYGLCHELGHVIAMWGDTAHEEDHHAWAHYTGVVIVERLSGDPKAPAALRDLKDVRWRAPSVDRKRLEGTKPSLADRDGILALLFALHDAVGPKAVGAAINLLDAKDQRLRVNRVRYYTFRALREALLATLKRKADRDAVSRLLP